MKTETKLIIGIRLSGDRRFRQLMFQLSNPIVANNELFHAGVMATVHYNDNDEATDISVTSQTGVTTKLPIIKSLAAA